MKQSVDSAGGDATGVLTTFLNTVDPRVQLYMIDLYDVTLANLGIGLVGGTTGMVLRWSTADFDFTFQSGIYLASASRLKRGTIKTTIGVEVGNFDVTLFPVATDLLPAAGGGAGTGDIASGGNQFTLLEACARGILDGADILLRRIVLGDTPNYGIAASQGGTIIAPNFANGAVTLFRGRVSQVRTDRTSARLTVTSYLELLNVRLPRNVYQPGCLNTLYDNECGLLRTGSTPGPPLYFGGPFAFRFDTTVNFLSTNALTITSLPPQPPGFFDQGTCQFTTGRLAGMTFAVTNHSGFVITLLDTPPYPPSAGNGVRLQAGCDKTQSTCTLKFGNLVNFRGFPLIPPPDSAI